jgi:hypothetical protein
MKCAHQVDLGILNLKILFNSTINMNMFFDFVTTIFLNHMFKVGLNRFIEIQKNVTTYKIGCSK